MKENGIVWLSSGRTWALDPRGVNLRLQPGTAPDLLQERAMPSWNLQPSGGKYNITTANTKSATKKTSRVTGYRVTGGEGYKPLEIGQRIAGRRERGEFWAERTAM